MNKLLKDALKKTYPVKWFLGKINNLEKTQKNQLGQISSLKKQSGDLGKAREDLEKAHKELLSRTVRLEKQIQALKQQNSNLRLEMNYLYYKGLHPDQYPAALKEWYKEQTGKTLDLEHPHTYNEKLQWMKLYDSTPLKTKLADKYLVRDWVSEKIGSQYLIPLLGVYDKFDDIDFDKLPDKFVIKTNHASGTNRIVTDKSKFNIREAREFFNKKMQMNFAFWAGLELHYKDIIPKIIIEEYIENKDRELWDYRFFVFNGTVKAIWLDVDSGTPRHRRNIFNRDWELQPIKVTWPSDPTLLDKPSNLEEMIRLAELLGHGFKHVRVDFYNIKGRIYFGEMTFTHQSGVGKWDSEEYNRMYGDWIDLPTDHS